MSGMEYIREVLVSLPGISGECVYPGNEMMDAGEVRADYAREAVLPEQTHSLNVGIVRGGEEGFQETDALVSFEPGTTVGVVTADCVPILLYTERGGDSGNGFVGAIHAGWRGTLGGIVDNALTLLEDHGIEIADINAVIGPAIHKENYEVSRELGDAFIDAGFSDYVSWLSGPEGKPHLDLPGINRERLLRRGVKESNIRVHPGCTCGYEGEGGARYPSYRRSSGTALRMLTKISMKGRKTY